MTLTTADITTLTQPFPTFVAAEPRVFGIDVSRWQGVINWQDCFAEGVKFAAIRCTVGNYYQDPNFVTNWVQARANNILIAPYLVVVPANSAGVQISAKAHWDYFKSFFGDRESDMPIVLDCELSNNQTKAYITDLIDELIWSVFYEYGRMPIIYTRQTWWDTWTEPRAVFKQCDLWAARYSETLDGPWSDGKYIFRDWDYWHFWQYSETGDFPPTESANTDFDYFNGTLEDLLVYCEQDPIEPEPPPKDTLLERIENLEAEQALLRSDVDYLLGFHNTDPAPPQSEYISVSVIPGGKVVAFKVKAPNAVGKPIMVKYEPVIRYDYPETLLIKPELIDADGTLDYYEMAQKGADGTPLYCRADKVEL